METVAASLSSLFHKFGNTERLRSRGGEHVFRSEELGLLPGKLFYESQRTPSGEAHYILTRV